MSEKLKLLISFSIYGIGLLSLQVADIFVSYYFSIDFISEWAFTKSYIFIISGFAMMGYDQLFIRNINLGSILFNQFLCRNIIVIIISTFSLLLFYKYTILNCLILSICVFCFSMISYLAAIHRAKMEYCRSQFFTNSWKIYLFICLIILHISTCKQITPPLIYLISITVTLICFLFFKKSHYTKVQDKTDKINIKEQNKLGIMFFLSNITLVIATYGEQFIINITNNNTIASQYLFSYTSILTPIALSLNGFIGFYYAPKLRKKDSLIIYDYKLFLKKMVYISLLVVFVSFVFGIYFLLHIKKINSVNWFLVSIILITCIIRCLYTANSVFLGIKGNYNFLKRSSKYLLYNTFCYLTIAYVAMYLYSGLIIASIISVLSLFHWITRFIITNHYTIKSLKYAK